jgi:hypothetical protein
MNHYFEKCEINFFKLKITEIANIIFALFNLYFKTFLFLNCKKWLCLKCLAFSHHNLTLNKSALKLFKTKRNSSWKNSSLLNLDFEISPEVFFRIDKLLKPGLAKRVFISLIQKKCRQFSFNLMTVILAV